MSTCCFNSDEIALRVIGRHDRFRIPRATIAALTEHFKQNTISDLGRYRKVKPNVVLEVAFNSIQPSTRHASGLALRFPRIKAIRRDKNIDSIDTLQYAWDLAGQTGEFAKRRVGT